MKGFRETLEFTGLDTPIGEEYELDRSCGRGTHSRRCRRGTFFRAVPDPAYAPFIEDGAAVLSGDGMVSARALSPGKVGFAIRYVQTERHMAEVAAGPRAVRQVSQSVHRPAGSHGPRPHGRQYDPGVARRAAADDQGGRSPVPRRPAYARHAWPIRLRRAPEKRHSDGARAHRSRRRASCSSSATRPMVSPRPRSPTASRTDAAT